MSKILEEIVAYLKSTEIVLSSQTEDGRINASINEAEIIEHIKKNFSINVSTKRSWYDFSIIEEDKFIPVNIKVTQTTQADNLNCKLGIYYTLTGLMPDFHNEIDSLNFFEKLSKNIGNQTNKDYYFLIFNKNIPKDIFYNSLRGLQELQANGNNLPFQCQWNKNREIETRTFEEVKEFLLRKYGESIKLRANMYFHFKKFFPEYV
jgi:hypothetical protein